MPVILVAMLKSAFDYITSPAGKFVAYALGVMAAVAVLIGLVKIHDDSIRNTALAQANAKQLESVIANNDKVNKQLSDIKDEQAKILGAVNDKNKAVSDKAQAVRYYLASPQAQKDSRASSDVLKNAIKGLSK